MTQVALSIEFKNLISNDFGELSYSHPDHSLWSSFIFCLRSLIFLGIHNESFQQAISLLSLPTPGNGTHSLQSIN